MRVYLDDERKAPVGWHRVYTADECIAKLEGGKVEELSLDHDLAQEHLEHYEGTGYNSPPEPVFREKTGYAVVQWMIDNGVWPPLVILHTMNPVARDRMLAAIRRYAPEHVRCEVRIGFRG